MGIFGSSGAPWLGALGGGMVLLAALAWVGGVVWQLAIWRVGMTLPARLATEDKVIAPTRQSAIRQFERVLWWLPALALLGNLLVLLAGALQAGASLGTGVRVVLTQGQFGAFWLLGQIAALGALLVLVLWPLTATYASIGTVAASAQTAPAQTGSLVAATATGGVVTPRATLALAERGLLTRDGVMLALGGLLLVTLALLRQATPTLGALALPIDLAHLLAGSIWLGSLFIGAVVLLPISQRLASAERAYLITRVMPLFTPLALAAIVTFALTGIISASATLTSTGQLTATTYGRVLLLEAALVAAMLGLTIWQFAGLAARLRVLRDRQATLRQTQVPDTLRVLAGEIDAQIATVVTRFAGVTRWLAALGVGVVICAALLGVLAGSLSPAAAGDAGRPLVLRQPVGDGVTAILTLPATTIGASAIIVTLQDAGGQPVRTATVTVNYAMLDMPMGTQNATLSYRDTTHDYSGSLDFLMAGRWQIAVVIAMPGREQRQAIFTIAVQQ